MTTRIGLPGGWLVQPEDGGGWKLGQVRVREKGKRAGEEYLASVTYHARAAGALERFLDRHQRECGATTLAELVEETRRCRAMLAEALGP